MDLPKLKTASCHVAPPNIVTSPPVIPPNKFTEGDYSVLKSHHLCDITQGERCGVYTDVIWHSGISDVMFISCSMLLCTIMNTAYAGANS